jgi:hypothetical protein
MNNYNRINWVDGMLINKEHFKGMENYLLVNIYQTNKLLLGSEYYGIINPGLNAAANYPWIKISIDASDSKNQKIIVEQIEFLAVSPDGTFLETSNESFISQSENVENTTQITKPIVVKVEDQKIGHGDPLYLVLLTLPFSTRGYGQSEDVEEPLRLPFCKPVSELRCVSSTSDIENIVGANHFPIAKIKIINHQLKVDNDYIPPCFTISAHYVLREKFYSLKESISSLADKINLFLKSNVSPANENIAFLKEIYTHLYFKIIDTQIHFNDSGENLTPKEVINFIKSIAIQFKTFLLCSSDSYTFFMDEWNSKYGINFQNITNEIETIRKLKYYDLNDSLNSCQRVLDEYLIKIAAITNYGQTRYAPKQMPAEQPPDDDYINL